MYTLGGAQHSKVSSNIFNYQNSINFDKLKETLNEIKYMS